MKILYATSEAAPFIKSGGLGDVLGALPPEISRYEENDVAVVLPYYSKIKDNTQEDWFTSRREHNDWRHVRHRHQRCCQHRYGADILQSEE